MMQGGDHRDINANQVTAAVGWLTGNNQTFDPNKHTHETTCTICYEDFQEGAIVNELKCDPKHFFHN